MYFAKMGWRKWLHSCIWLVLFNILVSSANRLHDASELRYYSKMSTEIFCKIHYAKLNTFNTACVPSLTKHCTVISQQVMCWMGFILLSQGNASLYGRTKQKGVMNMYFSKSTMTKTTTLQYNRIIPGIWMHTVNHKKKSSSVSFTL